VLNSDIYMKFLCWDFRGVTKAPIDKGNLKIWSF